MNTNNIPIPVLLLQFIFVSALGKICADPKMLPLISGECYHPTSQGRCQEDEWLVVKNSNVLVCERKACSSSEQVHYKGSCHHIYEDAVCGEANLGQRLFLNE